MGKLTWVQVWALEFVLNTDARTLPEVLRICASCQS